MKLNISKVGFVYVVFVLMGIVAVIRMLDLQFIHRPDGSDLIARTAKEREIPCTRGSIIASDGRYLAFSIPEYKVAMDCCQCDSAKFSKGVDSLAMGLAAILKDKPAKEYRKQIVGDRRAGKRYTRLTTAPR